MFHLVRSFCLRSVLISIEGTMGGMAFCTSFRPIHIGHDTTLQFITIFLIGILCTLLYSSVVFSIHRTSCAHGVHSELYSNFSIWTLLCLMALTFTGGVSLAGAVFGLTGYHVFASALFVSVSLLAGRHFFILKLESLHVKQVS